MHMVSHGMPLDPFDTHLIAEFPQDLANILAERTKDCFLPICRYDDKVVSAIPPDMALVLPVSHGGCSFVWSWRVHNGRNHIPLHKSTPERQSLFESHRQRRWLTHWSYLCTALLRPVFVVFIHDELTQDVRLLALAFVPVVLLESVLPSRLGQLSDALTGFRGLRGCLKSLGRREPTQHQTRHREVNHGLTALG
jgi:hypothetical protein